MDRVVDQNFRNMNRKHFPDLGRLLGLSAGETERAFCQESPLFSNGLFSLDDDGDVSASDPLKKMVGQPRRAGLAIKSLVLEKKTAATLTRADFDYINITHEKHYDHMVELLRKALKKGDKGINILFYGPPGTGKTELAKTLAATIKADLYSVSETSAEGNRLDDFKMARSLVAGDPKAMLLVDEAEDIFNSPFPSKLFLNRMLEKNETPVIWIANKVRSFDERHLRRFSYALELKTPPVPVRARIWRNELARKKIKMTEKEIGRLAKNYELPPSFAVSAIRAAKLTGDKGAIERTLNSLDYAITGRLKVIREENKADFNPALMNTNKNLSVVTEEVLNRGSLRFSLCLYGAPGTGKSEYARYLAERMGLEVLHKRASDILSMWVGEAEKNIAAAFQEAWTQKKFLIFDEADSLLQDRKLAHRSWEISQVNEMLNWMECHPYPFACTTNRMDSLDEACLRRLTYKVKYDFLTRDQARLAFSHFFGQDFEVKLDALTPGDFAVVARQAEILGLSDPAQLAALLAQEQEAKGVKSAGVGFLS
jgi:SpoVK/Ycf46/Vps4 family AAA+-type ATPase